MMDEGAPSVLVDLQKWQSATDKVLVAVEKTLDRLEANGATQDQLGRVSDRVETACSKTAALEKRHEELAAAAKEQLDKLTKVIEDGKSNLLKKVEKVETGSEGYTDKEISKLEVRELRKDLKKLNDNLIKLSTEFSIKMGVWGMAGGVLAVGIALLVWALKRWIGAE